MNEKIIVDDALISTDIDHLIKYLSSKKRVEINTLAHELKTKVDIVKKWMDILEKEGYVRIEYKLLHEFVVWTGEEEMFEISKLVQDEIKHDIKEELFERPSPSKPINSQEKIEKINLDDIDSYHGHRCIKSDEFEIAERANRIIIEKLDNHSKDRLEDRLEDHLEEDRLEECLEDHSENHPRDYSKQKTSTSTIERINAPDTNLPVELPTEPTEKSDKKTSKKKDIDSENEIEIISLKKLLSKYIKEIADQKSNIKLLEAEKEKLLNEKYTPLENKFKTAYDSVVEKLFEKESRIEELKERVIELPSKIDNLAQTETALQHIKQDAKDTMLSNCEKMERLEQSLREENERLQNEIDKIKFEANVKKSKIIEIAKTIGELREREQKLKKEIIEFNCELGEMNKGIASTYNLIIELSKDNTELSKGLENAETTLNERIQKISEMYSKIDDAKKTEAIIGQYVQYINNYKEKISDIENYVEQSEKDLAKLKEYAEIKYIRNYLAELDNISSTYGQELELVDAQEKNVEERINETRNKLNNLLKESRELVKSLEEKTSGKEFKKLVHEVKEKREIISENISDISSSINKKSDRSDRSDRSELAITAHEKSIYEKKKRETKEKKRDKRRKKED
ncbi:MAG: hypothetical protein AB1391_00120 [Candidatus Micrarchaeota archaeon]